MFIIIGRFQYCLTCPARSSSLELVWLQAELETERLISKRILKTQFISRRKEILTMLLFVPLQPNAMAFIFPMKDFCSSKDHETFN